MIDLTPFTAPGDARVFLRAPFSLDGDLVACNGKLFVVADGRGSDALERADIPQQLRAYIQHARADTSAKVPVAGATWARVKCRACDGDVTVIENSTPSSIGNHRDSVAARYVKLLQALPDCEISDVSANNVFYFRFNGGFGSVMALSVGAYVPPEERTND